MKIAATESSLQSAPRGYSAAELAEIVGVPPERVCLWVSQQLLVPQGDGDAARYDFRQLSLAQTLRDLSAAGASLRKLRAAMKRLNQRLPETPRSAPLIQPDGQVLVRLDEGELAQPDGQLCLEFSAQPQPGEVTGEAPSLRINNPRTAREWYDLGVVREGEGDVPVAIECYRRALLEGGPDKEICFALAHALGATGQPAEAAERYRQVVELDPRHADAWNNLGALLAQSERRDEACEAFRRVLELRPDDPRAHYNLADTLDELGYFDEAAEHWQVYLLHDAASPWASYARRRLAVS
jgi:tetratricopeptide (TPR) repeat protein